jgi:hypothetical protein
MLLHPGFLPEAPKDLKKKSTTSMKHTASHVLGIKTTYALVVVVM